MIHGWLDDPPDTQSDEARAGFLTYAQVRGVLDLDPAWEATPHGDLQVHSTDSDGTLPLQGMARAASELGRTYIACTDHSRSLRIANGQDEERLADQGRRIETLNEELEAGGSAFRLLRSIEMDVDATGAGDMDPAALAQLDVVLGAFHSALRSKEDQTARYVAALENPDVHVLAHPKARMYGRRVGIVADWPRVFDAAAASGKALEIDATIARQDLSVELATIAASRGVQWFSIGSDAHRTSELSFLPFGMAIASLAGISRERILNYRSSSEVRAWARALSASSNRSSRS
jgi:histidinol phosphatase-like PHP family hydrolase